MTGKYSKKASEEVKKAVRKQKRRTLKNGASGKKVTSRRDRAFRSKEEILDEGLEQKNEDPNGGLLVWNLHPMPLQTAFGPDWEHLSPDKSLQ